MSARLHAVVGPSGVGKDTLIDAAAARMPALHRVRRVITRPEAAGGEDFEGVSEAEFDRRVAAGHFVLHWAAHGLRYGIPAGVREVLEAGRPAVFNGSRAMLEPAARLFPGLRVIHVTAERAVLAERLRARGRESEAQIAARLERAALQIPDGLDVVEIDNSGPLEEAADRLVAALQPVRA
ncbi:phosphonate metabolism protein/1,5-bisphosphokinase (PRPP-forming) PhnN [Salipiger mucosus]|uniref:Ribose 1,5-bisphosphate phosphokinase PhnN n=1 Tax=Salipiger mucosus DSM 16094 TaxID=1123237 RepID=S9S2F5_9RHOB|nr:phosphonate metabolism protein/1,5-bisphosphokinase (PRPP-forming) PhnN [Salipiger mucosus]EPX80389.1 ATP-binding protein PhnN, Guanylate kinase [Salipiger mucosus DSM 16094]